MQTNISEPRTKRVTALPIPGENGIIYILEPGSISFVWDGAAAYKLFEQRVPATIQYPQVFKDTTFRDTKVLTA